MSTTPLLTAEHLDAIDKQCKVIMSCFRKYSDSDASSNEIQMQDLKDSISGLQERIENISTEEKNGKDQTQHDQGKHEDQDKLMAQAEAEAKDKAKAKAKDAYMDMFMKGFGEDFNSMMSGDKGVETDEMHLLVEALESGFNNLDSEDREILLQSMNKD